MTDKKKIDALAEIKSAMDEIKQETVNDPWTIADAAGKPLDTPMDNKTIKNAIIKRIPECRRIQLVKVGELGKMQIVVICELLHETAILIEDDANIFMRHNDLMNIVDNMALELKRRKKLKKTNKLPKEFFRSEKALAFSNYK